MQVKYAAKEPKAAHAAKGRIMMDLSKIKAVIADDDVLKRADIRKSFGI